ncbi:hypothetical protein D3Y59_01885 [Hymenobacter oligotrophus]|uniref:Uncharacterized protein n=1 Tax=Hymenobacter oligotrophus TaxID=2319843 RepID=A0A3B7R3H5_9BACT|nr:hypothetical protein [Hymenobacter oligotrophus]AYA35909.1 hypothetical protein D3Y59_01885 [Hymenobacter oligotrophus]
MANNQQGKRSQNDPNAPQNQGDKQSIQSSDQAQHMGSTDQSRSIQSGVPGIPSQMHVGADRGDDLEDQVNTTMTSGMGQNREGEGQNQSRPGNFGASPTQKGGESRSGGDTGSGMGTQSDQNASSGNRRNG